MMTFQFSKKESLNSEDMIFPRVKIKRQSSLDGLDYLDSTTEFGIKAMPEEAAKESTRGVTPKRIRSKDPNKMEQKRNRNKMAARRCRQKQKDRIQYLEKDVQHIETENDKIYSEIKLLEQQMSNLKEVLTNHKCNIKV